jgi:hypothetical protein
MRRETFFLKDKTKMKKENGSIDNENIFFGDLNFFRIFIRIYIWLASLARGPRSGPTYMIQSRDISANEVMQYIYIYCI